MIPGIAIFIVWEDVYLTVMNILCVIVNGESVSNTLVH